MFFVRRGSSLALVMPAVLRRAPGATRLRDDPDRRRATIRIVVRPPTAIVPSEQRKGRAVPQRPRLGGTERIFSGKVETSASLTSSALCGPWCVILGV
jgi:hypothetical protein